MDDKSIFIDGFTEGTETFEELYERFESLNLELKKSGKLTKEQQAKIETELILAENQIRKYTWANDAIRQSESMTFSDFKSLPKQLSETWRNETDIQEGKTSLQNAVNDYFNAENTDNLEKTNFFDKLANDNAIAFIETLQAGIDILSKQIEIKFKEYITARAGKDENIEQLYNNFMDALNQIEQSGTETAIIFAFKHFQEIKDGKPTPEAKKAENILEKAYKIAKSNLNTGNTKLIPYYTTAIFNDIPLFHSETVNKLFGFFDKPLPIDGKMRNLAKETEYYIEEINGIKTKKPLVIGASLENVNELIEILGLTQFDFVIWCLCHKFWNTESYFFTPQDIYKRWTGNKASGYMVKRIERAIERLSAVRLKIDTFDRNGNPKKEMRNMITTAGETRKTSNKKVVTGYIMLAPPAMNDFSIEMNPFYNMPLGLLNYPDSGKQDRAACISTFFYQRVELNKFYLRKAKKDSYNSALHKAKKAEKDSALSEHRKPNNKNLNTEKYYKKPNYTKYRVVINFDDFCEKIIYAEKSETEIKELKEIAKKENKEFKTPVTPAERRTLKAEAEKCLNNFVNTKYIEKYTMPAAQHNKTANIIIFLNDPELPLELESISEKSETEMLKNHKC